MAWPDHAAVDGDTGKPVAGSRITRESWRRLKSNRLVSGPARTSKEPSPMRPSCQLSSMNRITEVWSVLVWSTWFTRLHGEITRNGSRGPYPHRPWYPARGGAEP